MRTLLKLDVKENLIFAFEIKPKLITKVVRLCSNIPIPSCQLSYILFQ